MIWFVKLTRFLEKHTEFDIDTFLHFLQANGKTCGNLTTSSCPMVLSQTIDFTLCVFLFLQERQTLIFGNLAGIEESLQPNGQGA